MEALLLEGPCQLHRRRVDDPRCVEGEVRVTVAITGIGGSEYLGYANPGIRSLPSIMGHSIAGYCEDGRKVTVNPLQGCGNCRYCRQGLVQLCRQWALIGVQRPGGLAEQVAVPATSLVVLPVGMAWEQAALIEPFANAVNAWQLSGADRSSRVAVIGAGGLGLGVVAQAQQSGCTQVDLREPSPNRSAAAASLGARPGLSSEYDVVFDTVGTADTRALALAHCRPGGTCVLLGFAETLTELDLSAFIRSQKRLLGSFVYSPSQFQEAVVLAMCCDPAWVGTLSWDGVAPQLAAYLAGDFSVIRSAFRPG